MSARQGKVLKEFSQLQMRKRIELCSLGISQIMFVGKADELYKPRAGTQIYRIWRMDKLTERQQQGWFWFRKDVDEAVGKSGAVTSAYGEYKDHDSYNGDRMPVAYTNINFDRIKYIYDRHLGYYERMLLRDLLFNDLQADDTLQIEIVGFLRSGYGGEDSALASGVAHVQTLLDRLADYYGL